MMSQTKPLRIPTASGVPASPPSSFSSRRKRSIDVSLLGESQLRDLQIQDPFLYHSIPEVHRARYCNRDVDCAAVRSSCPASVERRSRVSTECHTSLLLEEILNDEEFKSSAAGEGDFQCDLIDLLRGVVASVGAPDEPSNAAQ